MSDSRDPRNIYRKLGYPDPKGQTRFMDQTTTTVEEYLTAILDTRADACCDVFRMRHQDGSHNLLGVITIHLPTDFTIALSDLMISLDKLIEQGYIHLDDPGYLPPAKKGSPD